MSIKLNTAARTNAIKLIKAGKVDKDSSWSITTEDEDKLLGDNDWTAYAQWFLGEDESKTPETKERFRYPVGKDGKVFRSALIAIRQRSAQNGADDVYRAAGELVDMIDDVQEPDGDADDKNGARIDMNRMVAMVTGPWAILQECLGPMMSGRMARVSRSTGSPARLRSSTPDSGSIAVIPVTDVITQHGDYWIGTAIDDLMTDFITAMNDPTVGAILMPIDSPGGSVYGVQELCDTIMAARDVKPVVAIANSLAASAAYWIGSAASEFYCTPSGEVGSIGVFQPHMDISGMLSQMGVKQTLISAGKYKVEGNPFGPLDDDAMSFLQSRVDDYYNAFVSAVAAGRGVKEDAVRNGMGQGRVLGAAAAQQQKMIDGVATIPQVVSAMQKRMNAAPRKPGRKSEHQSEILALAML